jgi:hypothetical protein
LVTAEILSLKLYELTSAVFMSNPKEMTVDYVFVGFYFDERAVE